jgi:hypothetical protein
LRLREHDHGKYAVNWRLAVIVVVAFVQLTNAESNDWPGGLIIRRSRGGMAAPKQLICALSATHAHGRTKDRVGVRFVRPMEH